MEHLTFRTDSSQRDEVKYAFHTDILSTDWRTYLDLPEIQYPRTVWLGYCHDDVGLGVFRDYPGRAGVDSTKIWNLQLENAHGLDKDRHGSAIGHIVKQTAAFVQSWFYLGLLECVLGKKVLTSYMTRRDTDGYLYLYSRNLWLCLQARVYKYRMMNQDERDELNQQIQADLSLVSGWMIRFWIWTEPGLRDEIERKYPGFIHMLEHIMASIIRLAEVIEHMRSFAMVRKPPLAAFNWFYPQSVQDQRRLSLRDLGWCDFQIRLITDTLNASTVDWIHATQLGQDSEGHQTCTEISCARNDIDESTYQQAHVCSGNTDNCHVWTPDVQNVVDILMADQFPVISVEKQADRIKMEVVAFSETDPIEFVAISHVWADGLGGKTETGLNACQLERIAKLCLSYCKQSSTAIFWLDSLCIPRVNKQVYYKALARIRDVYIHAESVLVIDKGIETCRASDTLEHVYARIYFSAWMQRMWTFEEAVLAKELVFSLKDGFHTYDLTTYSTTRSVISIVFRALSSSLLLLRGHSIERLNIGAIHRAFRYRLTNAPQEELLSVGGLLNMDLEKILKHKGDERMKLFWCSLRYLPQYIAFLGGPKLEMLGFRWAPKTLMYPTSEVLDSGKNSEQAECTEHGLLVKYMTIRLSSNLTSFGPGDKSLFYISVSHAASNSDSSVGQSTPMRFVTMDLAPAPSKSLSFNILALSEVVAQAHIPGSWKLGVALFCDSAKAVPNTVMSGVQKSEVFNASYVGLVMVEKIQSHESASETRTILKNAKDKMEIHSSGVQENMNLCIT